MYFAPSVDHTLHHKTAVIKLLVCIHQIKYSLLQFLLYELPPHLPQFTIIIVKVILLLSCIISSEVCNISVLKYLCIYRNRNQLCKITREVAYIIKHLSSESEALSARSWIDLRMTLMFGFKSLMPYSSHLWSYMLPSVDRTRNNTAALSKTFKTQDSQVIALV